MGEVIGFKPKDSDLEPLWMCPCGHKRFGLLQGGDIRCWQCGRTQEIKHTEPTDKEDATSMSQELDYMRIDRLGAGREFGFVVQCTLQGEAARFSHGESVATTIRTLRDLADRLERHTGAAPQSNERSS